MGMAAGHESGDFSWVDGLGRGGGGPVRQDGRAEPEMKGPRAEIDQRTADQEGDRADEREGGVREGRPNAGAPGG